MIRKHKPDGIVCGNDVTAGHLLHTLDELRVNVPGDHKKVHGPPQAIALSVQLRQPGNVLDVIQARHRE